jgi:hypothetical protein
MIEQLSFPSRRKFVGTLAGATGLLAIPGSISAGVTSGPNPADADEWFKKVKGKHRIIYDATEPHDGFAIIWAYVFYKTNNDTGTPDNDLTAVVVLRHNAIPLAMNDSLWPKYKLGENFKVNDLNTHAPAGKNPYYEPDGGPFTAFGIDGIKKLMARGVMFCVCDMALTVYSSIIAKSMELKPEDVKKDWVAGLYPGVQVVPSGVWAVGRAQEKQCAYCYAGG